MFSIGDRIWAPGAGPQEWRAQLWSKCWSCHSATGRQQFMIKQKMTHQDDSIEYNPWWNSALFRLSHQERTTMDSSVPLWPAHRAKFVCKLWAAAICEDWNCPDPSDWNKQRPSWGFHKKKILIAIFGAWDMHLHKQNNCTSSPSHKRNYANRRRHQDSWEFRVAQRCHWHW